MAGNICGKNRHLQCNGIGLLTILYEAFWHLTRCKNVTAQNLRKVGMTICFSWIVRYLCGVILTLGLWKYFISSQTFENIKYSNDCCQNCEVCVSHMKNYLGLRLSLLLRNWQLIIFSSVKILVLKSIKSLNYRDWTWKESQILTKSWYKTVQLKKHETSYDT